MLSFVLQKIRSKKWMVISLLLGNLLMVAIAAAGPMYSEAALQRTLTRNLSNYYIENNKMLMLYQLLHFYYNFQIKNNNHIALIHQLEYIQNVPLIYLPKNELVELINLI